MLHPDLLRAIDPTAPFIYRAQVDLTSVTNDNTVSDKIIIQDRPFICTRAVVTGFWGDGATAQRILPTTDAVDLTRIFMRLTGGQRDLCQDPVDIHAFNAAFGDDTFAGILFPVKSELIVTISNEIMTGSNYTLPVSFDIALFGYHAKEIAR